MPVIDQIPDLVLFGVPALVVVGAVVGLVARRSRGTGEAPPTQVPTTTAAPGDRAPEATPAPAEVEAPTVAAPERAEPGRAEPGHVEPERAESEATPSIEAPEPVAGRLQRLRARLARSGSPLGARLLDVLSRESLGEDEWDELEETLLLADVGAGPTGELVDALRTEVKVSGTRDAASVRALLRAKLVELVDPSLDRALRLEGADGAPAVVLVVGVNGTGKTTTVGKLARVLVAEGRTVLLGAADTFRAAAADQLETWGSRVGVATVRSDKDGADPASVAFDAVHRGRGEAVDVVLVDTAGRLQNKAGLMDELGKITRVVTREAPITETLLVLDATTGQNGMNQARVFAEVAGVTGIVLTKLDGTAKGGIVVAVQRELGVPVKLVGLGEGPDDLAPFEPEAFVDGLLGA